MSDCHPYAVTERSRLYRLIERGLDEDFEQFVKSRRQYYSWAAIAREVSDKSEIEVSDESLRRWFDTEPAESSAA
jgi:hypothetical protein